MYELNYIVKNIQGMHGLRNCAIWFAEKQEKLVAVSIFNCSDDERISKQLFLDITFQITVR